LSSKACRDVRTRFAAQELHFGDVTLEGPAAPAIESGHRVKKRLRSMHIFSALVTRDELRQMLWPEGTLVDFDTGLNSAMKKFRDEAARDVVGSLDDSGEQSRRLLLSSEMCL